MNNYIVIDPLSSGQFGQVLHIQNRYTKKYLAVKVESREIGLLEYEAKIYNCLAGIKTIPSIRSYKADTSNNYLFMDLMEYNLCKWKRLYYDEKEVTYINKSQNIISALINTLKSVHERGIIHRDIKPENICFYNGEIRLIDFGLAKMISRTCPDETTITRSIVGTPNYISQSVASLNPPSQIDELESLGYIYMYLILSDVKFINYCSGNNIEKKSIEYIGNFIDNPSYRDQITQHLEVCRVPFNNDIYNKLCMIYATNYSKI